MKVIRLHHLSSNINRLNFILRKISYAYIDTHWNFKNTIYPHNVIYIIRSGSAVIECNNKIIQLSPGNMYLIPANTVFSVKCNSVMNKIYVCANIYNEYGIDIFDTLRDVLCCTYSNEKQNHLNKLIIHQSPKNMLLIKSEILSMFSDFIEIACNKYKLDINSHLDRKYYDIIKYIQDNLSLRLKVGDIAKKFNYSQESLSRDFKNTVGINIKKYIDNLIVQEAFHLLISTDMTIHEIAVFLGFNESSHFSKFFKNKSNLSPSDYRNNNTLK